VERSQFCDLSQDFAKSAILKISVSLKYEFATLLRYLERSKWNTKHKAHAIMPQVLKLKNVKN